METDNPLLVMSDPSPKKNGGIAAPRQIRFVATDGQPQTKRRRVNAAYVKDSIANAGDFKTDLWIR